MSTAHVAIQEDSIDANESDFTIKAAEKCRFAAQCLALFKDI